MLTVKRLKNIAKVYPYLTPLVDELKEAHASYFRQVHEKRELTKRARFFLKTLDACSVSDMQEAKDVFMSILRGATGCEVTHITKDDMRTFLMGILSKDSNLTSLTRRLEASVDYVEFKFSVWLKYIRFTEADMAMEFEKSEDFIGKFRALRTGSKTTQKLIERVREYVKEAIADSLDSSELCDVSYEFINRDAELVKLMTDFAGTANGWCVFTKVDGYNVATSIYVRGEKITHTKCIPISLALREAISQDVDYVYLDMFRDKDAYAKNVKGSDGKYIQPKRRILSHPQYSINVIDDSKEVSHEEHQKD